MSTRSGQSLIEQYLDYQSGFYRFPESDFVGNEKSSPRAGNNRVGNHDLMRHKICEGIGQLAKAVAYDQMRRPLLQLKTPNVLEFPIAQPLKGVLDDLDLLSVEGLDSLLVRRLVEYGRAKLYFYLISL